MTDASVNNAAAASAKPCPGGETASANCGKGVVVQGNANKNGAAPFIPARM